MKRQIISIDEEKCNGCGICAEACREGALGVIGGKARLIRDDHCDGMGGCLPSCPSGALSFEVRDALPFNENATQNTEGSDCACNARNVISDGAAERSGGTEKRSRGTAGELSQWPIQLKLVPKRSKFYENADVLIAADCTAFANADFHEKFIKKRITIIGCPKFDSGDYIERLSDIFSGNEVKSVTVARMQVPCCHELERMAKTALAKSQKRIPHRVVVIGTDGTVTE